MEQVFLSGTISVIIEKLFSLCPQLSGEERKLISYHFNEAERNRIYRFFYNNGGYNNNNLSGFSVDDKYLLFRAIARGETFVRLNSNRVIVIDQSNNNWNINNSDTIDRYRDDYVDSSDSWESPDYPDSSDDDGAINGISTHVSSMNIDANLSTPEIVFDRVEEMLKELSSRQQDDSNDDEAMADDNDNGSVDGGGGGDDDEAMADDNVNGNVDVDVDGGDDDAAIADDIDNSSVDDDELIVVLHDNGTYEKLRYGAWKLAREERMLEQRTIVHRRVMALLGQDNNDPHTRIAPQQLQEELEREEVVEEYEEHDNDNGGFQLNDTDSDSMQHSNNQTELPTEDEEDGHPHSYDADDEDNEDDESHHSDIESILINYETDHEGKGKAKDPEGEFNQDYAAGRGSGDDDDDLPASGGNDDVATPVGGKDDDNVGANATTEGGDYTLGMGGNEDGDLLALGGNDDDYFDDNNIDDDHVVADDNVVADVANATVVGGNDDDNVVLDTTAVGGADDDNVVADTTTNTVGGLADDGAAATLLQLAGLETIFKKKYGLDSANVIPDNDDGTKRRRPVKKTDVLNIGPNEEVRYILRELFAEFMGELVGVCKNGDACQRLLNSFQQRLLTSDITITLDHDQNPHLAVPKCCAPCRGGRRDDAVAKVTSLPMGSKAGSKNATYRSCVRIECFVSQYLEASKLAEDPNESYFKDIFEDGAHQILLKAWGKLLRKHQIYLNNKCYLHIFLSRLTTLLEHAHNWSDDVFTNKEAMMAYCNAKWTSNHICPRSDCGMWGHSYPGEGVCDANDKTYAARLKKSRSEANKESHIEQWNEHRQLIMKYNFGSASERIGNHRIKKGDFEINPSNMEDEATRQFISRCWKNGEGYKLTPTPKRNPHIRMLENPIDIKRLQAIQEDIFLHQNLINEKHYRHDKIVRREGDISKPQPWLCPRCEDRGLDLKEIKKCTATKTKNQENCDLFSRTLDEKPAEKRRLYKPFQAIEDDLPIINEWDKIEEVWDDYTKPIGDKLLKNNLPETSGDKDPLPDKPSRQDLEKKFGNAWRSQTRYKNWTSHRNHATDVMRMLRTIEMLIGRKVSKEKAISIMQQAWDDFLENYKTDKRQVNRKDADKYSIANVMSAMTTGDDNVFQRAADEALQSLSEPSSGTQAGTSADTSAEQQQSESELDRKLRDINWIKWQYGTDYTPRGRRRSTKVQVKNTCPGDSFISFFQLVDELGLLSRKLVEFQDSENLLTRTLKMLSSKSNEHNFDDVGGAHARSLWLHEFHQNIKQKRGTVDMFGGVDMFFEEERENVHDASPILESIKMVYKEESRCTEGDDCKRREEKGGHRGSWETTEETKTIWELSGSSGDIREETIRKCLDNCLKKGKADGNCDFNYANVYNPQKQKEESTTVAVCEGRIEYKSKVEKWPHLLVIKCNEEQGPEAETSTLHDLPDEMDYEDLTLATLGCILGDQSHFTCAVKSEDKWVHCDGKERPQHSTHTTDLRGSKEAMHGRLINYIIMEVRTRGSKAPGLRHSGPKPGDSDTDSDSDKPSGPKPSDSDTDSDSDSDSDKPSGPQPSDSDTDSDSDSDSDKPSSPKPSSDSDSDSDRPSDSKPSSSKPSDKPNDSESDSGSKAPSPRSSGPKTGEDNEREFESESESDSDPWKPSDSNESESDVDPSSNSDDTEDEAPFQQQSHTLSDYELKRERNVARIQERLKQLGLLDPGVLPTKESSLPKKRKRAKKKTLSVEQPTRRSPRLSKQSSNEQKQPTNKKRSKQQPAVKASTRQSPRFSTPGPEDNQNSRDNQSKQDSPTPPPKKKQSSTIKKAAREPRDDIRCLGHVFGCPNLRNDCGCRWQWCKLVKSKDKRITIPEDPKVRDAMLKKDKKERRNKFLQQWRRENRERIREHDRRNYNKRGKQQYYKNNKERIQKRNRKYKQENKVRILQQQKQHYQRNKEKIKEKQRQRRRKQKEEREKEKDEGGTGTETETDSSHNY